MILGGALVFCHFAVAQGAVYSWDFSDCEIKDILFAVSVDTGISIVPDDTVSGKGDLKFAGGNFDLAFEAFLKTNRLFVKREGSVWTVSRCSVSVENGLYFLEAYDLLPVQIVEKLSGVMNKVVTYESLPAQKISVCFRGVSEAALVECLAKRFGGINFEQDATGYHFVKNNYLQKGSDFNNLRGESFSGMVKIEVLESGCFSVDVEDCRLSAVLDNLGHKAGKEFCLLSDAQCKLQRSVFVGSDFEDTLEILCAQCGFDFLVENGIYYIFENAQVRNELVSGKRSWRKFTLCFTKSQDFLTFIFKRLGKLETILLPDEYSFLCFASEKEASVVEDLICEADIKQSVYIVNLKYLKPSEFLEHLPPSVDRTALFVADDSSRLYFRGTEDAYKNLCQQIEICDRPEIRLSYDLLILQYDETLQNDWASSFGVKRLALGDRNEVSAILGSVMGLNLNVVSSFGLTFAADLQASIEESKTRVYADTTLHGISGREIHFQNTNTYRYRDNNVDPETGKPVYSGVTREIASGIKLDVLGWVSGDGMITSKVTASVSRQGNDTSASTGNPPPTSEKIVTTEVRGKSGEPLVLSGLVQTAHSEQEKRSPLISKIPVLGNLFKSKNKTEEKMQMVIYLVPHVQGEKAEEISSTCSNEDYKRLEEGLWNLYSHYEKEEVLYEE
ncbi:hypothetical protein [Treponema bryantii]|uniref:hypothetical protein n=1 Tax=Treponema bryantii TaxID=163 RepID=UPI000480BCAF|nr:hypothetical protein [Treponema bryantii]